MSAPQYIPRTPLKVGDYYFEVPCPNTGQTLYVPDDSRGTRPYSAAMTTMPCHHCQTHHRFGSHEIRQPSRPAQSTEG